jgi:hypothetical protein
MITSVAALHHMDARVALRRMDQSRRLAARSPLSGRRRRLDPWRSAVAANLATAGRTYWEQHSLTVWPPPHTYTETGRRPPRAARRVLPAPSAVALLPCLGETDPSYAAGPGRGCSQEPGHRRTLAHRLIPDHQEPNVHAGRRRELVNGRSRIRTTVAV